MTYLSKEKRGKSLLRGVVGKGNALLDVALESLDGSVQQGLLLVRDIAEDVDRLLGTVGLSHWSVRWTIWGTWGARTPSSIGTEKNSQPVFSAISLPPGTPGR